MPQRHACAVRLSIIYLSLHPRQHYEDAGNLWMTSLGSPCASSLFPQGAGYVPYLPRDRRHATKTGYISRVLAAKKHEKFDCLEDAHPYRSFFEFYL